MRRPKYIHLYIEKYDPKERVLLLDFLSEKEFDAFAGKYDLFIRDRIFTPTMMLVSNMRLRTEYPFAEGSVYRVPLAEVEELPWECFYCAEHPSAHIAFYLDEYDTALSGNMPDLSSLSWEKVSGKQFEKHLESTTDDTPCGLEKLHDNISVVVKNVGQGSWNGIYTGNTCTAFFDMGCSIYYTKQEMRNLLGDDPFADHPTLLISHWDIDHYNLLTVAEDNALQNLCCAFIPDSCMTLTSKQVADRLYANCNFVHCVSPIPSRRKARIIGMETCCSGSNYMLFTGERSSSKNLSGLAIALWTGNNCVLLCADHSYYQVFERMLKIVQHDVKSLSAAARIHLVVPHHGGNAGSIQYIPTNLTHAGQAIVSLGPNQYGHPLTDVRSAIYNAGFHWITTEFYQQDIRLAL